MQTQVIIIMLDLITLIWKNLTLLNSPFSSKLKINNGFGFYFTKKFTKIGFVLDCKK